MSRTGILLSLFVALSLAIIATTIWNRPHRDAESEDAVSLTAIALFAAYANNEHTADQQYLNKTLQVTGTVTNLDTNQDGHIVIVMDAGTPEGSVACTMRDEQAGIGIDDQVTVKGICTGLLMDVVLTDCVLAQ
jgi:hypothetical protein